VNRSSDASPYAASMRSPIAGSHHEGFRRINRLPVDHARENTCRCEHVPPTAWVSAVQPVLPGPYPRWMSPELLVWYTNSVFTGLVEDVGTVVRAERRSDALIFHVRPNAIPVTELVLGESVCHDGTCLTVTEVGPEVFTVLAGAETLSRTTLGGIEVGTRLNLERAMKVGDRLGGHWVTGHIDGTGELASLRDAGANLVLGFRPPPALLRYIVEKGSIAVAGVSLTVNAVDGEGFSVAIIPHTYDHTTLGALRVGDRVNLEVDILAKHVEKLLGSKEGKS